ncbi:NADP-dependent oxidoreductase domain-containing protein [Sporodiniella umbellata]|nr:NADP-dependent oxidoreductase domain-containing protein [Sporodiniella umbellata]
MIYQKTFELNNGEKLPAVGLGTWKSSEKEDSVYNAVKDALRVGYRHIDTATNYGNESEVGRGMMDGLKASGLRREEIFVTTKLAPIHSRPSAVPKALEASLTKLKLEYVDLYMMHWPVALNPEPGVMLPLREDGSRDLDNELQGRFEDTWAAMEKLLETGKVKSIGVANFSIPNLKRLLKTAKVIPAVNQVELHPYLPQQALVDFCVARKIHVTAYSPLGSGETSLLKDPVLNKIASARQLSVPQVLLSWGVARTSVLPKSVHFERIQSNIQLVDLEREEIEAIDRISETYTKRFVKPDWGVPVFDEDFK